MRVLVQRSRARPAVALAAGVVLMIAALDISTFHVVYPEAETNEETGQLTNDGKAQRRGDIAWGLGLGLAGAAMVVWGVRGLVGNRRLLAADEERIVAAIGPPGSELWSVGWNEVYSVRSTLDEDDTGPHLALDIELAHDSFAPIDPRGARVDGDHVIIDAEDWRPSLDIVVSKLQVLLDRSRA